MAVCAHLERRYGQQFFHGCIMADNPPAGYKERGRNRPVLKKFDQFGVELGKEMAKAAEQGGDFDASTTDLIRRAFGE